MNYDENWVLENHDVNSPIQKRQTDFMPRMLLLIPGFLHRASIPISSA